MSGIKRWLSWRLVKLAHRLNPDMLAAMITSFESQPEAVAILLRNYETRFPTKLQKDLA